MQKTKFKTSSTSMLVVAIAATLAGCGGVTAADISSLAVQSNSYSSVAAAEGNATTLLAGTPLPTAAGSGTKRNYELLWSQAGGLSTGDIVLSKSFRLFDEIVTIGSNDNNTYYQHYRFTPAEYDIASATTTRGLVTFYERDSVSWNGLFISDTVFDTIQENAKLHAVYGVTFEEK
ncbi:hypothetical protein K5M76_22845 (plasmid) [Shewanella xiamenensis]|jgi:uncharacterized protein YceK|uniref:Lipoprotein n=1 Tax=Shewanella xiamenensis TaxID=332186 RepID=A0AAE4TQL6_9GAMM|nr:MULTISPECIES: hypothetical protein [Shewanella]MCT8858090.1 hypothetical protein [Shewanella xiamenensis]MDH0451020.1 hypothetical protein [Shewanella sp. GD04112]MDV5393128.1 hypothetical protein [Shewanella xiamenensis]UWG66966.1 hypothetical protein K5M76_22845 [Shewanella xiamenensis]